MLTRIQALSLVVFAITLAIAGCGDNPPATAGEVQRMLAGSSWVGTGTFEQVLDGSSRRVTTPVRLDFDANGVPLSLPALGMVSPWQLHVSTREGAPERALAGPLTDGGTLWAHCPYEADGDANQLDIEPAPRPTGGGAGWSYRARYRFADLTTYELYDYNDPTAFTVEMQATDAYGLARAGGQDRLTVAGRASAAPTATTPAIRLQFDAQLVPGEDAGDLRCRLGPAAP